MSDRPTYVPMVKGKHYDLAGTGAVQNATRSLIKPFVEALPIHPKRPSVEEHVFRLCEQIRKNLPLGSVFVDFHGLPPEAVVEDGANAVLHGYGLLKAYGRAVTPAYGFERNDEIWTELGGVTREFGQGFCFRLSPDDLFSYASDEVWSRIIERTAQMGLGEHEVDVLLDLRSLAERDLATLAEQIIDFLFANSRVAEYRSIILAGSSALKDVSNIDPEHSTEVVRQELYLWANLWRDMPDSVRLTFADYGVVHPDFSDQQGPNKYMNAKIRYTVGDKIIYHRGHGLIHPVKDFNQYHNLARQVVDDPRYRGRPASFGDRYVHDCANRLIKPGTPATWVKADMNHHVCYTAEQIARLAQQLTDADTEIDAQRILLTI